MSKLVLHYEPTLEYIFQYVGNNSSQRWQVFFSDIIKKLEIRFSVRFMMNKGCLSGRMTIKSHPEIVIQHYQKIDRQSINVKKTLECKCYMSLFTYFKPYIRECLLSKYDEDLEDIKYLRDHSSTSAGSELREHVGLDEYMSRKYDYKPVFTETDTDFVLFKVI